MPKGYTTKEKVQKYLATQIEDTYNDQIDSWIESIEVYIDRITGRNFKADDSDTERRFDGNGEQTLLVDDFISLTKIEVGHDVVTTFDTEFDDYYLYPANKTPKYKITLKNSIFPRDNQNVKLTGKFGYSAKPPEDIVLAATVFVVGVINYTNKADGEVESISIGRYQVTYKDEKQWQDFDRAKDILESYRKFKF